mmetsp:Transcript_17286/g.20356  ORF Transcript_17286/g.20356 Transcript_17286/m.20356 type:complete len:136 (+) Transcript_17286:126-533(+)
MFQQLSCRVPSIIRQQQHSISSKVLLNRVPPYFSEEDVFKLMRSVGVESDTVIGIKFLDSPYGIKSKSLQAQVLFSTVTEGIMAHHLLNDLVFKKNTPPIRAIFMRETYVEHTTSMGRNIQLMKKKKTTEQNMHR